MTAPRHRTPTSRFAADRTGGVGLQFAVMLPVMLAVGFLIIDGGRLQNLHTSIQKGTDALALAGAAELDRRPDSIARATTAIRTLVTNDPSFAEGASVIDPDSVSVRFLATLPASDDLPITTTNVTTDPMQARFAEVSTAGQAFRRLAPAGLFGDGSETVSASTVAGFDQGMCNFAPMFICNPFEGTSTSLFVAAKSPEWRRRLIALRQKSGSDGQYGPGNYGFLEPPSKPGASELRDMIAVDRPPVCFIQNGVEMRPGFIASAAAAFNVRFDIYEGPLSSKKSDPAFRPAQNVRKGYLGNRCNASLSTDPTKALGLPKDSCFATGTCPSIGGPMDGRIGDGKWDFDGYWSLNFGSRTKPTGPDGRTWSNTNPPSRYDVYRYEIDNGLVAVRARGGSNSNTAENGAPMCYSGGDASLTDKPDRRVITGAILNCRALDETYGMNGSSVPPLPAYAFGSFFLTEPVADDGEQTIWAELIDLVEPGAPGAEQLRDIVQIYR